MLLQNALLIVLLGQPVPDLNIDHATMAARVLDSRLSANDRGMYLSALEHDDFPRAVEVSGQLLSAPEESLRFRAAWIVADGGGERGLETLRSMARNRKAALTLPMIALGRLQDSGSHELLRALLRAELDDPERTKTVARVMALVSALSNYRDPTDARLLAEAVGRDLPSGSGWGAEELGETGGADAIPVLEAIFTRSDRGWNATAAGLGLARCRSPAGEDYVRARLADTSGARHPDGEPQDGVTDGVHGPRATSTILEHMGVPADEPFVPMLLAITSSPQYSDRARALAWQALLRINSSLQRQQVLEAAWRNLIYESCIRLIALNDMGGAQARLSQMLREIPSNALRSYERSLKQALAATEREKRRWRESRGYAF